MMTAELKKRPLCGTHAQLEALELFKSIRREGDLILIDVSWVLSGTGSTDAS